MTSEVTSPTLPPVREGAPRVAIVGGGLAGIAAAIALRERGVSVSIFESRRRLGGRAASFVDPATGDEIDHCQHVSMGCCVRLADFCRRAGIAAEFERVRVLHFFGPDGRRYDFSAHRWLPAPFHLAPSFMRLDYLTLRERWGIARTLFSLARKNPRRDRALDRVTIGDWLRGKGQTAQALERFWSVVLVSALGESLERASFWHARKVFIDGFLGAKRAYEIEIPRISLGELYGARLLGWLNREGVQVHLGVPVRNVSIERGLVRRLTLSGGAEMAVAGVVAAVPWRRVLELFEGDGRSAPEELVGVTRLASSPIAAVHLWFDREITPLRHAILIGKLSQWLFARPVPASVDPQGEHYYQVVISASRQIVGLGHDDVVAEVREDLAGIWPESRNATLLRSRIVSDPDAVFSVAPGIDAFRPPQESMIANLAFAGDWTRTGWPATMEGAIVSGNRAADHILSHLDIHKLMPIKDLRRGRLVRWLPGTEIPC